ncbi:2-keto-4-pentenoate hydratase [Kangiella sp. M94]
MKKALLSISLVFSSLVVACVSSNGQNENPAADDLKSAYQLQYQLVQGVAFPVIGYKAGLTSEAGQKKFNVSEPVAGAIFQEGLAFDRHAYLLSNHTNLMLETEIGFILNQNITQLVTAEQLPAMIKSVVPVIELPDLRFENPDNISGHGLIVNNVASNKVLVGKPVNVNTLDINQINTILTRNGKTVIKGKATDAMGDQWQALAWLINRSLKTGYPVSEGNLLITGALGPMIPAERGQYDADFGQLGKLAFSIR